MLAPRHTHIPTGNGVHSIRQTPAETSITHSGFSGKRLLRSMLVAVIQLPLRVNGMLVAHWSCEYQHPRLRRMADRRVDKSRCTVLEGIPLKFPVGQFIYGSGVGGTAADSHQPVFRGRKAAADGDLKDEVEVVRNSELCDSPGLAGFPGLSTKSGSERGGTAVQAISLSLTVKYDGGGS